MDLSSAKVTPEQKVSLCTKYFYLGFLCLPFLWGVNAAWFFGEAFRSKTDYLFRDSGHLKCQLTLVYNRMLTGNLSSRARRKLKSW